MGTIRAIVATYELYFEVAQPLASSFAVGGAWGMPSQDPLWARTIKTLAGTVEKERSGQTVMIDLRCYPLLPVVYAAGLGALSRGNYSALRCVTTDPDVRVFNGGRVPAIALLSTAKACPVPAAGSVLALSEDGTVDDETIEGLLDRGGNRHTPISDHLFARLRPMFSTQWPDEDDYDDAFDELETLLGLIATDARLTRKQDRTIWMGSPIFGRSTWKHRYSFTDDAPEVQLQSRFDDLGGNWPPLQAGLFGGDPARARAAFEDFGQAVANIRQNRF